MRLRGHRGLTLVEILVVIVTMTVLMAILFPLAQSAYTQARRSACMTNLQNLAQAVAGYQQDNLVYPEMPGVVGVRGIQQGGLAGMCLVDPGITAGDLWCEEDPAPAQFGSLCDEPEIYHLTRDNMGSTYDVNYNYFGFVTSTTGMPFPITTREAMVYLVGDPRKVAYERRYNEVFAADIRAGKTSLIAASDAGASAEVAWIEFNSACKINDPRPDPADPIYAGNAALYQIEYDKWAKHPKPFPWDLGVVNPDEFYVRRMAEKGVSAHNYDTVSNLTQVEDTFPKGMYPALCNVRAPKNTIVAICPHHPTSKPAIIPAVTISGAAIYIKPILPRNIYAGDMYNDVPLVSSPPSIPDPFFVASRRNANEQFEKTVTQASINRFTAPIDWRVNTTALTSNNSSQQNNSIIDVPFESTASSMPLVQTHHRVVDVAREINAAQDTYGYSWYDTGVEVGAGDLVMVVAQAKWGWGTNTFTGGYAAPDESVNPTTNQADPSRLWVVSHLGASYADQYAKLLPDTKPRKKKPTINTATLLLSADGDPVEMKKIETDLRARTVTDAYQFYTANMLLPSYRAPRGQSNGAVVVNPHCLLVGTVGEPDLSDVNVRLNRVFALGSRGSHYVLASELTPGVTNTLRISLNDTAGASDYRDNNGSIELWIAVFHRP